MFLNVAVFFMLVHLSDRSAVKLAIRKVQFEPDMKGSQPTAEVEKKFLMSDKPLLLEATLDKDVSWLSVVSAARSICKSFVKLGHHCG